MTRIVTQVTIEIQLAFETLRDTYWVRTADRGKAVQQILSYYDASVLENLIRVESSLVAEPTDKAGQDWTIDLEEGP